MIKLTKADKMSSKDNKRFGYVSEQKFIVEALDKNLEVLCPVGEYLPIDFVVMNRAGGMMRTQVKATDTLVIQNKSKRYQITACEGGARKPIDCTKVDVVACYVKPHDQWYLIPCLSLGLTKKFWLYPQNEESKGKFEKYKDNWEIFDTK
jgi:hypothetical protein